MKIAAISARAHGSDVKLVFLTDNGGRFCCFHAVYPDSYEKEVHDPKMSFDIK